MMISNPLDVEKELERMGPVWVYVEDYRLTHGRLTLRLTDKAFHSVRGRIVMTECIHISGPTLCGPVRLSIVQIEEDGDRIVRLATENDQLVVKALRASFAPPGELEPEEDDV
jgi:hypothetical protein